MSPPKGSGVLYNAIANLSPAHQAMLKYLSTFLEPLSIAEIAELQGLHQNSVRESIDALTAAGLVERSKIETSGRGRPAWAYYSTAPENEVITDAYLTKFIRGMCEMLKNYADDPEKKAYEMGINWADELRPHTENFLEDVGIDFDELKTFNEEKLLSIIRLLVSAAGHDAVVKQHSSSTIQMRACPFVDIDGSIDPIMCEMHRGQLEKLAHVISGGRKQLQLAPLTRPGICEFELETSTNS
ncbi:putative ArsR family transcriptional regulator [Arcanobacterium pluranimalium]|nr:putative ArsR family transcriptional regulator [Arcanobacterium pluranimalium]